MAKKWNYEITSFMIFHLTIYLLKSYHNFALLQKSRCFNRELLGSIMRQTICVFFTALPFSLSAVQWKSFYSRRLESWRFTCSSVGFLFRALSWILPLKLQLLINTHQPLCCMILCSRLTIKNCWGHTN